MPRGSFIVIFTVAYKLAFDVVVCGLQFRHKCNCLCVRCLVEAAAICVERGFLGVIFCI